MDFTLKFIEYLFHLMIHAFPILGFLAFLISILAILVGRREGWKLGNSLYYGFVTATTVGYGDFHPIHRSSKVLSIFIAILGLIMTGIIIALSVESVSASHKTLLELPLI